MTYHHIRVEPLATALGAEIGGIDLATPLPDPALAEIRQAFGEHGVIFFRDQHLTPEQHLAFASASAASTSIVSSRPCPVIR
jgi:taurine dioxygenase